MENRLKAKTKTANFHRVFDFDTITQHPYALPVIFCKLSVIICIKCWALLHKDNQEVTLQNALLMSQDVLFTIKRPVCINHPDLVEYNLYGAFNYK